MATGGGRGLSPLRHTSCEIINLVIDRMTEVVRIMCCHLDEVVLPEKIVKAQHRPLDTRKDESNFGRSFGVDLWCFGVVA